MAQNIKIFGNVDEKSRNQATGLSKLKAFKDSKIRIMPDAHYGKDVCVGFTSKKSDITKNIIPSTIGVDIGCGVLVVDLGRVDINLAKLDSFIKNNIPTGFQKREESPRNIDKDFAKEVKRISELTGTDYERHLKSLGTLGGGNHFIEVSQTDAGNKFLVIHSGSRNFGLQVATKYMKEIQLKKVNKIKQLSKQKKIEKQEKIKTLKHNGQKLQINYRLREIDKDYAKKIKKVKEEDKYLNDQQGISYIKDSKIAIEFAERNREIMAKSIVRYLGLEIKSCGFLDTIHNYIDTEDNTIRKGAVSAKEGEYLAIPINSRFGTLICKGKGNEDWNMSAPHGAGRLLSRTAAKKQLTVESFKDLMSDVYTSTITEKTLDESPEAYKNPDDILSTIDKTVEVLFRLKPIYSLKG